MTALLCSIRPGLTVSNESMIDSIIDPPHAGVEQSWNQVVHRGFHACPTTRLYNSSDDDDAWWFDVGWIVGFSHDGSMQIKQNKHAAVVVGNGSPAIFIIDCRSSVVCSYGNRVKSTINCGPNAERQQVNLSDCLTGENRCHNSDPLSVGWLYMCEMGEIEIYLPGSKQLFVLFSLNMFERDAMKCAIIKYRAWFASTSYIFMWSEK